MEEKVDILLRKIRVDEIFKNRFFNSLANTDNPYPWFNELLKEGYLNPTNNKEPYVVEGTDSYRVPFWDSLPYIENLTNKIKEENNIDMVDPVLNVLNNSIKYTMENNIDNYNTNWRILKSLFNLPLDKLEDMHFEYIEYSLNSKWNKTLVSKEVGDILNKLLLNDQAEVALKLFDICIRPDKVNIKSFYNEDSILGDYWFTDLIKNNYNLIENKIRVDSIKLIISQILNIIKNNESRFNQAVITTIEPSQQNMLEDRYEVQIIYLIRNLLENSSAEEIKAIIYYLFNHEVIILKRISIYIINKKYTELNDLFWDLSINPLMISGIKHELYELFKENASKFTSTQIDQIIEWIKTIDLKLEEIYPDFPEKITKFDAYYRREWLTSLMSLDNEDINTLYHNYYKIHPVEIEHPGFDIWTSGVVSIAGSEPLPEEIRKLSNTELADYIIKLPSEKDYIDLFNSFESGLRYEVNHNIDKYLENLEPFLVIPEKYQYAILQGIRENLKNEKIKEIQPVLNYIRSIYTADDFWADYDPSSTKQQLIKSIAEVVEIVSSSDNYPFTEEIYAEFEKMLILFATSCASDLADFGDIVTSVLNSTLGTVYSAMILVSIRRKRMLNKEEWDTEIRNNIDTTITDSKIPELYVTIGKYINSIINLDREWAWEKITHLLISDNEEYLPFMESYLFYNPRIYVDLYQLIRSNKGYIRAFDFEFSARAHFIYGRVSQHITTAYLNDLDKIDNDVFSYIIDNKKYDMLSDIVLFLWRIRNKLDINMKNKVMELWDYLLCNVNVDEENETYRSYMANMIKLCSVFDILTDEVCKNVSQSLKYIEIRDHYQLLEIFKNYVITSPECISKLFYQLVSDHNSYPSLRKEDIIFVLNELKNNGQSETADKIRRLYVANGLDFVL